MILLHSENEYAIVRKLPGEECEHELPELLSRELGGESYCVHRLDRAVGGVMVYARTKAAAAALGAQMQDGSFEKEYLAVLPAIPEEREGELRDFLFKDSLKGRSFVAKNKRSGVKEALLSYRVLSSADYGERGAALVRVKLHTGRFHQIRCQFAARQMPLLGDGKYGSREKGCPIALLSCRVSFLHPLSRERVAYAITPEDTFPWNLFGGAEHGDK